MPGMIAESLRNKAAGHGIKECRRGLVREITHL